LPDHALSAGPSFESSSCTGRCWCRPPVARGAAAAGDHPWRTRLTRLARRTRRCGTPIWRLTRGPVTAPATPPTTAPPGPATAAPATAPTPAPPTRRSVVVQDVSARSAKAAHASCFIDASQGQASINARERPRLPPLFRGLGRPDGVSASASPRRSSSGAQRIAKTQRASGPPIRSPLALLVLPPIKGDTRGGSPSTPLAAVHITRACPTEAGRRAPQHNSGIA
jgi:pyruvate/2-oxoglutarate dehydrogenase complex dihydrolipoamide acyltransferase (E2) component